MKLRDLEVIVTSPPPPGWGGRYWQIVRLTTACGITGLGEVYASAVGPEAMGAVISDVFTRHMEGESPENIELMSRRVQSSGFTQRPDPTVMGAFAGLEMACWDILGKARERPVWALLGGQMNDRLRAYSYLYPQAQHPLPEFWINADMAAEAALALVEEGWTAVKFDPAGPYTLRGGHMPAMSDISTSVAFCKAIREAVGDRADLLFGTHGQFSVPGATRLGRAIAPHDPLWFEEPIPPDDPAGMARVARGQPVPIATGERLCTAKEFLPLLAHGAVGIVQPALGRLGGIWEGKRLAILAQAHSGQIAPHLYAGPVEWAANVHLAVSCPNYLMVEAIETEFHEALIRGRPRVEGGFVEAPRGPGLGIELNDDIAAAHPLNTDRLHLEMQEAPCDWQNGNAFGGGSVD
ncbi:MAG: mandelate racemase/muconate lactonizing enzyme family protein [Pseudomonadota bacterium]